jgi:hypothetical protein
MLARQCDGAQHRELIELIELSSERDVWLQRLLAAERESYRRGKADGRAEALAELADNWHSLAVWVLGDNRRRCYCHRTESELAAGRVASAAALERHAAGVHWRQFMARAFKERPELRTPAQQAAVDLARKQGAA